MQASTLDSLLLYCRAGFEKECAAEVTETLTELGLSGYAKAKPQAGYVLYKLHDPEEMGVALQELDWMDLVFARQLLFACPPVESLPPADRVTPLVDACRKIGRAFSALLLETADTNEAKELSAFCRKFEPHLRRGLEEAKLLREGKSDAPRLHVFFLDSSIAHVAVSLPGRSSPWPMGIPRLRLPRAAPSRSALKLAEALHVLLGDEERAARLKPGMSAVDLGAAPGGWSWQLAQRGLRVTAVDNGRMDAALLADGMVEHVRSDGFTYRPERTVDWLVCDMVEQPSRIASLVGQWLARGWCREAVFNLKLPMNKRYDEVKHCRLLIDKALRGPSVPAELRMKQLYHDREEVTAYLHRLPTPKDV